MQLGIPQDIERINLNNFEHKLKVEGWIWMENIPVERTPPHYPIEILRSDPCYSAIELAKDEFGVFNVTVGPPLRNGKPPGKAVLYLQEYGQYGLYILPDLSELESIIEEWEKQPKIRSFILEARLDRWIEDNG